MNGLGPDAEGFDATRTGNLAAAGLKPGTVLAKRFRIDRLLGIGGMGMVYAATDLELDIAVAVKLLRPELALRGAAFERIRQELLIARQVSSPHVVRIHDLARDGERAFITMDLIDGEPLDRRLERLGVLGIEEAVGLTLQIAEGLEAAHARQVVHRDLKPSNILLDAQGRALIADFGVARSLATGSVRSHSGSIVGTPEYLSPEQARGLPVDGRSDLYTLGLLLFEMLTGRLPFDAATPAEAMSQRLLAVPRPLRQFRPEAPQWLEQLLARMLRTQPAHRLGDAAAVIRALREQRVPRDHRSWRRWTIWALLALVLLGGAVWAGWRWWPVPLPVDPPAIAAPAARLLVLADAGDDPSRRDLLEGQAAVLRRLLDGVSRWPVIDAERANQSVAQLRLTDGAAPSATALWTQLPGVHVLRVRPGAAGATRLEWQRPDATAAQLLSEDRAGAMLWSAARAALVDPQTRPSEDWPADLDTAALSTYGRAVRIIASGAPSDAGAELDALLAGRPPGPGRALLLLERVQLAVLRGELVQAGALLESIGPALPEGLAAAVADLRVQLGQPDADAMAVLARRAAQSGDDLWVQLAQARAIGDAGDHGAALAQLGRLCERDPGDPRAWFLRGKYAILRGDARAAVDDFLVRALVLYKRSRHAYGEAETVNALGVGYARLGQLDDAAEQYEQAVTLRRQLGNRRGEASTLRNLAQVATVRGQADRAGELLAQARQLFEQLGDAVGEAAIDNELGLLAEERGDYTQALAAYRRGLRVRERLGNPLATAESLNNIGFAHYQLGDYDSAQVYWRQAGEAYLKLDDLSGRVRTAQNLGLLETARGRLPEARQQLAQSLTLAEQQQMVEESAVSLRNLAELDLLEGRLDSAQRHLARARSLFAERGDQRGLVDVTLLEVQWLRACGHQEQARARLAALRPELTDTGSLEQRALAALLATSLAGSVAEADAARREAASLAGQSGVRVLMLDARLLAAEAAADATLGEDIASLGNLPLTLRWLERRLTLALDAGATAEALSFYRQLVTELRPVPGHVRAWAMHTAGQQALEAAGEDPVPARTAARDSARVLLAQLPADADPERRRALEALTRE